MVKKAYHIPMTAAINAESLKNLIPFEKGKSGNPDGKKKGQRDYATIYRVALEKIGKTKGMTPEEIEELMEQAGLDKALQGDFSFQKDIKDRIHGKPDQKQNVNIAGTLEVIVKRL